MKTVGTIIDGDKFRPFIFDEETSRIILDQYCWERHPPRSSKAENYLVEIIAGILSISPDKVRLGRYFCENCRGWFAASSQEWSFGMCLNCSLDRDSDFSENYEQRN